MIGHTPAGSAGRQMSQGKLRLRTASNACILRSATANRPGTNGSYIVAGSYLSAKTTRSPPHGEVNVIDWLARGYNRRVVKVPKADLTVAGYLARTPAAPRKLLRQMRETIRSAVPREAAEVISYRMPAFKHGRILVWY